MNTTQVHIVLLRDSIFDNGAYVPVDEAVIHHLKRTLPPFWNATLVAHDGDVVDNIESQLAKVPPTTTHLVLSVGGNDALQVLPVMSLPAKTVHEALEHLTEVPPKFHLPTVT